MNEGKLNEAPKRVMQGLKDTSGKMWDYHWEEKPAYVIPFNEPRGEKIKVKDIKDKKLKVKIKQLDKILREGKLTEDYKKREWEVYVGDDPYGKNRKVVKVAKSKRAAVILYNKLIKTDKYFEVGMRVKGFNEGKLTEKKFIPTVTIEKYGKEISVEKFKTTNDAKKYTKQMIKKYKLKWVKGFWGNPKTGIELTQNFS